ncbi:MAG: hypothetical protein QOK35_497 [Pseudonocardiales bacterium]|nr:hypothetical protein [Pseudonocardiales bacterium]
MDAVAPVPEVQREALIAEVAAVSDRIVAAEVVDIARAPDGRVVWLDRPGLSTLLEPARMAEFRAEGVADADVPGLPVRALVHGRPVGRVEGGAEAHALRFRGLHVLVITVEPDGRIADTRPRGPDEALLPWDGHTPVPVTVRLECDWGSSPFWVQEFDDGPFDVTDEDTFREMFDVPAEVMAAVHEWSQLYEDHLDRRDPANTRWGPGEERRYHDLGHRAVRLLEEHLPDHVSVRYLV